jgi:hypothetical protein
MTGRRIIVLCALVMAVCAVPAPAAALADSMSLAISNTSPATGTPVTVTVATNASPINSWGDGPFLYVDVQPSSAGGCQATYGQDMQVVGQQADQLTTGDQVSTGSATNTYNATEYTPRPYTVCSWLENTSNDYPGSSVTSADVTATGSSGFQTLNTDTLAGSLSNANPRPNIPISVRFGGSANPIDRGGDGPYLYAVVQPASAGLCQTTYGGDIQVVGQQADQLTTGNQMSTGQFTGTFNFSGPRGTYRVCAWLEDTSDDYAGSSTTTSDVLATAVPITFRVGSPPPPACVVPSYRGATLATIEQRLRSAHCSVGHIRRIRDHHVRRNHVVRLSSSPGARLPNGTRVGITVSRG